MERTMIHLWYVGGLGSKVFNTQFGFLVSHPDLPSLPQDTQRFNTTTSLFSSLSLSRAREHALLYGDLAFLPYTAFTNSSGNGTVSSYPILAFTRSWSCVQILVLLNVGPEVHIPDPDWAPGLPKEGVFVASTGMDRMGPTSLDTLELQPHEAVVIKF